MSIPRSRFGILDWTRGHGIPFDRSTLPADDEITDLAAWLAGRFDSLAADEFVLSGESSSSTGSGVRRHRGGPPRRPVPVVTDPRQVGSNRLADRPRREPPPNGTQP